MSGKDFLLRHIYLLPEEERDALLAVLEGKAATAEAIRGAKRLVGRSLIPALGYEELL